MSETAIEWTERTWNPTTGCDRVSPGCDHCYALTMAARLKGMGQAKYQADGDPRTSGPGFALTVHPDTLDEPVRRRVPTTYFVNSMSDLFHQDVPMDFILRVWSTMSRCEQHTFQVLTKRPQRMAKIVDAIAWEADHEAYVWPGRCDGIDHETGEEFDWYPTEADLDGGGEVPLPNVWLGTSIENDRYTFRADHLRATPAAVRFLSCEPLLGPLPSLNLDGIDWVIVGGESGPGARPMHPDWARDIRDRCVAAGVAFFFKQWGTWGEIDLDLWPQQGRFVGPDGNTYGDYTSQDIPGRVLMSQIGKKATGRLLDGRTWDEMPTREGAAA